jgi:dienelactone hydrolase
VRRAFILLLAALPCLADESTTRRQQALADLKRILPPSYSKDTTRVSASDKSWEEWQQRTGELPPDFQSLPSEPFLPDPLKGVKTKADWQARRKWIREQYEQWIIGKMPPPPGNVRAIVTNTQREHGAEIRDIRLEFGPNHKGILTLQLIVPNPQDKRPRPVFLTNHPRHRPWVAPAVRRGYIAAIFSATDPIYGAPDDSDKFIELYPDHDFSGLARWAWAGMRVVDYLVSLPEVDKARIGITGHSRNSKAALISAAFDERISAVVASSGNTGECDPWRFTTDPFANETIEQITGRFPGWFHPRLRFFAGREDKLPVDQNLLMSLVAPRGLLMASAYSEAQGNSFGMEQAFRSVEPVYRFTGAPQNLGLSLRPGEHATTAEDIEAYVDFFDTVFGRSKQAAPRTRINTFDWDQWRAKATVSSVPRTGSAIERIRWLLGEEPPAVAFPARNTIAGRTLTSNGWLDGLFERPIRIEGVNHHAIGFGDDLHGDLYMPPKSTASTPVVIWLHPYAYPTGYSRYGKQTIADLAAAGYAVFAFDHIGFGTRLHQATRFYDRYPDWSLLGKMVADTRAAIDALSALRELDSKRIYLAGYSLGGKIALFTAALDNRVAAVVAASAFTPWRDVQGAPTEGIRHYSHLHGILPRLGFYLGREREVPVDYDEILSSIKAPVYLRAPTLDRYAIPQAIRASVQLATKNGARIHLHEPTDFNRLPADAQREAWRWLKQQ